MWMKEGKAEEVGW